ncbi:hypothetical protein Ait01nite_011980 [Actinoplanes italicus]|uniref:Uncharacterized protein n=1 Tax=Actinoplanes italicus TaxID=113567 RepID=A0A2T0KGR4_9ACTN|nr:hypothetical protein CLV67_104162 [Actinoplanes italicus]GIE28153.1 hypothetical protein Ait01nite_011980 [Actinoplanes italicus]
MASGMRRFGTIGLVHFVTATAIDLTGHYPVMVEVHLAEADGRAAVILGNAPLIDISEIHGSRLPSPLDLRCEVVGRDDDQTVLIRLRHGVTDREGRDTFRVAAEAVRSEGPDEILERLLLEHHVDPDAVTDVECAWLPFTEFAQTPIDGLAQDDADGVIVRWGRYSWTDRAATLTFTRRLALWQASLVIQFRGFTTLPAGDTGWDLSPPGPARAAALTRIRSAVDDRQGLRELWYARPSGSSVTFRQAD